MRILFTLSYVYLPYNRGGTETNTDQLCQALQQQGHQVAVLSGLSRRSLPGIVNMLRCRIRRTDLGPPDEVCGYPVYRGPHGAYDLQRAFAHLLPRYQPDVVVAQQSGAVTLARQALASGVPALVYVHSPDLQWLGLEQDDTTHYLANSRYTARRLRDDYGIVAPVLYNLFDPAQYTVAPVGRFVTFINPHPQKGLDLAVELAERCRHIQFLFVGSWLGYTDFMPMIKASPNITWLPATADMRSVYEKTKVLIVPSVIDETWGRVVSEAQFSGIPVLASDRGGLPESVGPGGLLLPDQVDAWQVSLEMLWRDHPYWNSLSQRALQHAGRSDIQPETVVARFVEELHRVVV